MQKNHLTLRLTAVALAAMVGLAATAGTALLFDTRGHTNAQLAHAAKLARLAKL